jgi:ion channel-forming bestrophin family protein
MNTANNYKIKYFIRWTRTKIYKMLLFSTVSAALFYFLNLEWMAIPWVPVALLGTATAFISGFRNTQTYNRTWEARQVFGGIIGASRVFGIMIKDFVRIDDKKEETDLQRTIIYRHLAWLTALRFQLREVKPWENTNTKSYNREYLKYYSVPEWNSKLEEELKIYLEEKELQVILSTKNRAVNIMGIQSTILRKLNEQGVITSYNYVALENQLKTLLENQGKCERIKNFPYPRQFASVSLYFTSALCFLLPLGFLGEFSKLVDKFGPHIVWLTIPFSVLIGWVFLVLEQIGEATENPFEGNPNDVPITQMSRNVEIDLREILGDKELPHPYNPVNGIVM